MLTEIQLENFQSHDHSVIKLDPGVNTFIGTSDHGKSSIMRAVSLVAENRPDGNGFISHWAINKKGKPEKDTRVKLKFDDGVTLERVKGVDNAYVVTRDDKEPQEFRAMGKTVPDEIVSLMNLSDTNIQKQEHNFFLFAETSGEVIRRINSYTNLGLIDTALSNAEKDLRENRNNTKTAKSQEADIDDKLKAYEVLDDLESKHEQASKVREAVAKTNAAFRKIEDALDRYDKVERSLESYKNVDSVYDQIITIQYLLQQIEDSRKQKRHLDKIINNYRSITGNLSGLLPEIEFSELDALQLRIKETSTRAEKIDTLLNRHTKTDKEIEGVSERLESLHERYHEEMGETCPLCGSPVEGVKV
jgi:DNA repair protein SbcC/Rad50